MERQKPINPWWTLDEPVNSASAPAKGSKLESARRSVKSDAFPERNNKEVSAAAEMDDATENNASDTGEEE